MSATTNTPAFTPEALSRMTTAELFDVVAANKRVIGTIREAMYGIKNWRRVYPIQRMEWNRCQYEKRQANAILRERGALVEWLLGRRVGPYIIAPGKQDHERGQ